MTARVLILGGYGNFGKRIAQRLTGDGISVIIAGRNPRKADALKCQLPDGLGASAKIDVDDALDGHLKELRPRLVVNTCGPFQNRDYRIAQTAIQHGIDYIDLADGRAFVSGIGDLDGAAKAAGVAVVSGASTLPALSSAVIEYLQPAFSQLHGLRYGISPGQKTERGLATVKAILTYVGKPFAPFKGAATDIYGWQGLHRVRFPVIGSRWMANCDVPDLDLFTERYDLHHMRFSAGLEVGLVHLSLWALSWGVRLGVPLNLPSLAAWMLWASNRFDWLGTSDGGMHLTVTGLDLDGQRLELSWFIIARENHGPFIPVAPAIALTKKLLRSGEIRPGAYPCVGVLTLREITAELESYKIQVVERATNAGS